MKKLVKIIIGLILLAGVSFAFPGMYLESWGKAAIELMKGSVTIIVALIGLALIIIGFSELRN